MQPEARVCLEDLIRATDLILGAMVGISLQTYLANWEKQAAVERQFMIIGEALIRLRRINPAMFDRIPDSRSVVAFRNILVHGYDAADPNAIFRLTQRPLEELRAAVSELIDGK